MDVHLRELRYFVTVADRLHFTAAADAVAAAAQEATLVIGMSTGIGRGLLPAVRARFAAAAPSAKLFIRQVAWDDPTGGVGSDSSGRTDAAFVWLPVPDADRFSSLVVATVQRVIALPPGHRLTSRDVVEMHELLDEPFLALPMASGSLRDYWLAVEARDGPAVRVGAEIANGEETVEALAAGFGVCLLAAGNAPLDHELRSSPQVLDTITASSGR